MITCSILNFRYALKTYTILSIPPAFAKQLNTENRTEKTLNASHGGNCYGGLKHRWQWWKRASPKSMKCLCLTALIEAVKLCLRYGVNGWHCLHQVAHNYALFWRCPLHRFPLPRQRDP